MFGSMQRGVNAYAKVGLETGVSSASPHKLIVMLYDGALVAILSALRALESGNIAGKGAAISKAIDIVDNGLRAALDTKAGGEIASSLDALYAYISSRLLKANLHNDAVLLEESHKLLSELRDAWNQIGSGPLVPGADTATLPARLRSA